MDGAIDKITLAAMQVTVHDRIRQILINMERCRWLPIEAGGDYLLVNIPEFFLHAYQNDRLSWSCRVVTGSAKPLSHTVIFNDSIEYIVFSPYWNIPEHILLKETLPAIKRDAGYLRKTN